MTKGANRKRAMKQTGLALIQQLEARTLFAAAVPTPYEVYLVELINRARANPNAEVLRDSPGTTFTPISQTGWVASDSTHTTGGDIAANAVDGNLNTRWSTDANQASGQYFEVDMGSVQSFNTLNIDAGPSTGDYPQTYSVYVSNTDTDWATQPAVAITGSNTPLSTAGFATQSARYVRIVNTGSSNTNWWSIAELTIGTATNPAWGGAPDLNEGIAPGTISTSARQPLAINPYLTDASEKHSLWMGSGNGLNHNEGTVDPLARDVAAGYPNNGNGGENIGWDGTANANTLQASVTGTHNLLFVDPYTGGRGHRTNLLSPGWSEVGGGVVLTKTGSWVTEDFGNSSTSSLLCGITFNDANHDNFYEPGEEAGGVTITATRTSDNAVFSTTSWTSGGYSLPLSPGTYSITVSGSTIGQPATQMVTIANQNVEADFLATTTATPAAPVIVTQPVNTFATLNSTATFSVGANGSPTPTVQWQVSPSSSGGVFTNITGATGFTYSLPATSDINGYSYRAVVTNSQASVISNSAALLINQTFVNVTTPPQDQTVNAGDTATFSIVATNYVSLQWQWEGPNATTFTNIPGATSPTLTFTATASSTGFYQVVVNSPTGGETHGAFLTVNAAPAAPAITAQPVNTNTTTGNTATVTVGATGFPTGTVQWQMVTPTATAQALLTGEALMTAATSNSTFTNIPGADSATLTVPVNSVGTSQYRAVITNAQGSVTTSVVTVTGNTKAQVTNDLSTLRNAMNAALASINYCKLSTARLVATLNADLRRLKATAAQKKLVSTLKNNEAVARANFTRHETTVFNAMLKAAGSAKSTALLLRKHPTNSKLSALLQAALARLSTAAAASTAPVDATHCKFTLNAQLPAISAVDPTDTTLQLDIEAGFNNNTNISQSLQAPVTVALQISSQLATDAHSD